MRVYVQYQNFAGERHDHFFPSMRECREAMVENGCPDILRIGFVGRSHELANWSPPLHDAFYWR